ncbi:hypothetical protein GCG54_00000458 [Colletotrichum gloeosporioides]|uniref:Zn(2)-C6 fungal-type domain-containing protein n=1 Tax=Colletotrichum gloeosporioides TaxID=474922 RepID=A0A8H4CUU2_COLGL|nr:uncharacterized protein GCG54_00000458 [Colletotrichum gloeosporioides]KAF3810412.1 hypothetical protein GCG54_00000458 [Colletotrichum gloeosporioides]
MSSSKQRKQYSSCDNCRRSRIACNASKRGYQPGDVEWRGSCSRCALKQQPCTFTEMPDSETDKLSKTSSEVRTTPVIEMFRTLDRDLKQEVASQAQGNEQTPDRGEAELGSQIEGFLRTAIKGFAARWAPQILQSHGGLPTKSAEDFVRESWRAARRDMLKVINRVSYQSVLALYLFTQTPIPTGIPHDEVMDGIDGLTCLHTALSQIQRLRERRSLDHLHELGLVAEFGSSHHSVVAEQVSTKFLDLETRLYWTAVVWDTESSLTSNLRASLTSGLKGACLEPVWLLARAFLVGSFIPQSKSWLINGFEVYDKTATEILSAASVANVYLWKTITSLKEALREGVDEKSLLSTWEATLDALEIYNISICPLLGLCERRLNFLNQESRLNWFELNLKHYLGILKMVEALEAASRSDLLAQITETRQEAEREIVNVLKFGTETKCNIHTAAATAHRTRASGLQDYTSSEESAVSMSPWIAQIVESVSLLSKIIHTRYLEKSMQYDACTYLVRLAADVFDHLPNDVRCVGDGQDSLQKLREMIA